MSEDEMRKEENLEHEVLDRLKNLEPSDFDYNVLDESYVNAMLKARNIILDLYQQEKEKNKELEKENWIMRTVDKQYISKDRIKELKDFYIQEHKNKNIDLIPFENIIDNLNILEE